MDYELLLSSEAERCMEEQLLWVEVDETGGGAELADRWMVLLEAALDRLRQHPERVTVLQVRHEQRPILPKVGFNA